MAELSTYKIVYWHIKEISDSYCLLESEAVALGSVKSLAHLWLRDSGTTDYVSLTYISFSHKSFNMLNENIMIIVSYNIFLQYIKHAQKNEYAPFEYVIAQKVQWRQ